MSTSRVDVRPNVWSMAVVHQYYRREFELAPRIVRDIRVGEDERQRQAAYWFALTLAMMHHHHVTEDAMMYPLLEGQVPQPLLARMDEQHQRVASLVDEVETRLAAWRPEEPASGAALADAFDLLLPELIEHLDAEEDDVMPYVAELLTAEEYARQGTSGNEALDPRTLMLAFGAMIEQASAFEAEVMLAHPPEHVRRAWRDSGAGEYRALMDLLRADLRPNKRTRPAAHA